LNITEGKERANFLKKRWKYLFKKNVGKKDWSAIHRKIRPILWPESVG
jgi:hypothetical protein